MCGEFNPTAQIPKLKDDDRDFRLFLENKYSSSTTGVNFKPFNPTGVEKTRAESDKEEYEKQVARFNRAMTSVSRVPVDPWQLAWSIKNLENKRSKTIRNAKSPSEALYMSALFDQEYAKVAKKYGYTPDEVREWQSRNFQGFLAGLAEVSVDIRDTAIKSLPLSAGLTALEAKKGGDIGTAVGATAGAGIGAAAGGVGAVPGAGAGAAAGRVIGTAGGAVSGLVKARKLIMPLAVAQDTFVKEQGSFIASEVAQNPNMTQEEFDKLKLVSGGVALASAAVEAISSEFLLARFKAVISKTPGGKEVVKAAIGREISKLAKDPPQLLSVLGGKTVLKEMLKTNLGEITEEEIQEIIGMAGEMLMGHEDVWEDSGKRLGQVGFKTFQSTLLLSGVGAAGHVRIRNKAKEVSNVTDMINQRTNELNGVKEGQTKTEQNKTEQATTEQAAQDFSNVTDEALTKSKAEQTVRMKETDNAIAKAETQLEQAKDLGLTEEETTQISSNLEQLKQDKVQLEDEYRSILTEESVRQAKAETETKLESVNKSIEQANNALDQNQKSLSETQAQIKDIQKQIKKATKKKEDTSALSAKLEKLLSKEKQLQDKIGKQETNLVNLEKNQEKLLGDKAKLESGENIEDVLKGKKTIVSSHKIAKNEKNIQSLEKQMKEEVEKANAKGAMRVAKAIADGAKKSLNSLIKGYKEGKKGQEKETRTIRSTVAKILRESGIHRSELGAFDSVLKKIVTVPDLVKRQEELYEKLKEVLEKRQREEALKFTKKLRKMARPFKGSPVRGKMTPEIQRKIEYLFSLTRKSLFEAEFDIQQLLKKYRGEVETELSSEDREKALEEYTEEKKKEREVQIKKAGEHISRKEARLKELKEQEKQARKEKKGWEGKKPNREGAIQAEEVESKVGSYNEQRPKGKKKDLDSKSKQFKIQLAQALSFINGNMKFGDLKVEVEETAFDGNAGSTGGTYNRGTQILTVKKTPETYVIFHEIGHYFDQKVARLFEKDSLASLTMDYFLAEGYKANPIIKALHSLIDTESKRLKKESWFHKLSAESQAYLLNPQEIFARVFNAAANKVYGVKVRENIIAGKVGDLTYTVPETTINDLFKVMNEVKYYEEFGAEIVALEKEIDSLYQDLKELNQENFDAEVKEMMSAVPKDVSDLMYYLQLAADLENRTADEIMKFNELVATLIYEGRDIREAKKEAQAEERKQNVEALRNKLKELATNTLDKKGKVKNRKAFKLFMHSIANFKTKMNTLFGSELAEKWSTLLNDSKAQTYVFGKKEQFMQRATEIYGYNKGIKGLWGVSQVWKNYLKEESTYTTNIKGEQTQVHLNRMNIIGYYIYSQNELGKARLDNMFTQDVQDSMFSTLTEEDIKFAELCIEMADTYNDVNEVFKKDRDTDLPKRQKYFPFASETQEITVQSFIENNLGFQGGLPSFTKSVNESEKVYLKAINPVNVLFNHFHSVSDYVNGYLQNKELAYALKDQNVQNDIKYYYGESILNSLMNDVNAITFGRKNTDYTEINKGIDKFVNNYIVAAIAAKPTIFFKQFLSFVNFSEKVPVTSFFKYLNEFNRNPKKAIDFMMKNEYLRARFAGGNQVEELAHAIEGSNFSKTKKLVDFLTLNVRLGDIGAIVYGGYAEVQYLIKEKGYTQQQAFDQFIKDTAETQQFNSRASISGLQAYAKQNSFMRGFFAFTNTPYQYLNKTYNVILQAKRGEISKKQAAKTVFIYQVLNPFLYNTATSLSPVALLLASMYGDEDKKDEALKELMMYDLLGGVLTGNMDIMPINVPEMAFRYVMGEKNLRGVRRMPLAREVEDTVVGTFELIRDLNDLAIGEISVEDIELEEYLKALRAITLIKTGLPVDYIGNVVSAVDDLAKVGDDDEIRPIPAVLKIAGYSKKKAESIDIE